MIIFFVNGIFCGLVKNRDYFQGRLAAGELTAKLPVLVSQALQVSLCFVFSWPFHGIFVFTIDRHFIR